MKRLIIVALILLILAVLIWRYVVVQKASFWLDKANADLTSVRLEIDQMAHYTTEYQKDTTVYSLRDSIAAHAKKNKFWLNEFSKDLDSVNYYLKRRWRPIF